MVNQLAADVETFFFAAALLALGVLRAALWPRLAPRFGSWADWATAVVRGAHEVGIPYLALISGALAARDVGLVGFDPAGDGWADWARGLGWTVVWAGLAILALARLRVGTTPTPAEALLDEVRWAFYRGVFIGWVGHARWGVIGGVLLALLEWGLIRLVAEGEQERTATTLVRLGQSTSVFLLSGNVWLPLLAGPGTLWLAGQWQQYRSGTR